MNLGRIGIWRSRRHGTQGLDELEALGYSTFWIGGSPSTEDARPYLEAAGTMTIATGILNAWQHEPADVAAGHAALTADFPGRFVLGLGIGHPEATSDYTRPLTTMRRFLDGPDGTVPKDEPIVAALRPKMLGLGADRSLGAFPYFVPVEHTRFARGQIGPDAVLATEVAVVLERDAETARAIAREYAATYLSLRNYASNLRELGYDYSELAAALGL